MLDERLKTLVKEVCQTKSEGQHLEITSARGGAPNVMDTLSSFSNQRFGGIILFGINEKKDFQVCGVYNSHLLQKKNYRAS